MQCSLLVTLMIIHSFGGPKVRQLRIFLLPFGLQQLICERTNFERNKHPTCIDLIVTDQSNLVLNSGTRPSLDSFCHHQIIHCKEYLPRPRTREIFSMLIRRKKSLLKGAWLIFHNLLLSIWQVKTLTDTILNWMFKDNLPPLRRTLHRNNNSNTFHEVIYKTPDTKLNILCRWNTDLAK